MLCPEVQKLIDSGDLHEFDVDWIERLPVDKQLAAAKKCTGSVSFNLPVDLMKSCVGGHYNNGPNTHQGN